MYFYPLYWALKSPPKQDKVHNITLAKIDFHLLNNSLAINCAACLFPGSGCKMAVAHGCGGSHMKTILVLVCLTLLVNSADRQEITRSRDGGFNVLLAIDKQISEDSRVLTKVQVRQLQKSTWIAKDGVNPVLCNGLHQYIIPVL